MKEFVTYTALRIGLFLVCYAVLVGIWLLLSQDQPSSFLWAFITAVVASSLLSFKLLQGPRDRLAHRVQERADKASAKLEGLRNKEDEDDD